MRNLSILVLLLLSSAFVISACSSKPTENQSETQASSPDTSVEDYPELIKRYSGDTKKYDGFHQSFEVNVTILNTEVNFALLQRRAQFQDWKEEKVRQEREKSFQEMAAYSRFFLSFFTPETENNDLHKPNTIWKIYLETNGQRYEGKVKKDNSKQAELRQLYPYVDRFRTPYYVTFEVPMSAVEKQSSTLILTSSLGSASFVFPPVGSR